MKGSRNRRLFFFLILSIGLYASNSMAKEKVLSLSQKEYASPLRAGTLEFYIPDSVSPLHGNPLDTGLWVEAKWYAICGTGFYMSGGTAKGWLLGPIADENLLGVHSTLLGTTAAAVFGVVISDDCGLGSGTRIHCDGGSTPVEFGLILIYILARPNGKHVADLQYITEISPGGEWYKLSIK